MTLEKVHTLKGTMVYYVALQPSSLRRTKKVRLIPQVLHALYLKLFAKPFEKIYNDLCKMLSRRLWSYIN
jgi:hypothetical protein